MNIDTAYFHHVCITVLYGMMVVLTFVIVERFVYYWLLNRRAARLKAIVHGRRKKKVEKTLKRRDLLTRSLREYIDIINEPGATRARLEDLSSALFIDVNGRVGARLWILDTIVTAAPLLGLLGTILGIMDTFNALSAGGISDPGAVSRGIGAALLATAIGIGTALYGLLGHNLLHRMADHITEEFKGLILAADGIAPAFAPKTADATSGADQRENAVANAMEQVA
ncbi:biopolymer transport protein ExbB [Hyphomicrobium sp. 1Nfss2.1]|uniref:MotA/TolQ/ExbB proton channel family protein n=1 Tax=Hyphomicrobium sp. 1Nfss2.1 TaxID=3413936 RepID=UPI003C7DA969